MLGGVLLSVTVTVVVLVPDVEYFGGIHWLDEPVTAECPSSSCHANEYAPVPPVAVAVHVTASSGCGVAGVPAQFTVSGGSIRVGTVIGELASWPACTLVAEACQAPET